MSSVERKKRLFPISAIVVLLFLTPMFILWTSAQTPPTLNLSIDATGDVQRKGNCFLASLGAIEVELPSTYTYRDTRMIGNVNATVSYSYEDLSSLTLIEEVLIHIHVDGSFRRLNEGNSATITLLEINGCTSVYPEGVQYCIYVYSGNVGTVTRTGPNTWQVEALIPAPEQGAQSLCVNQWVGGKVVDGFCIPLYGFEALITGTLTV